MDLNELQSVRDRERQTDKLQGLRESFYADAAGFIQQLRAERDRAVERADNPFDSPEVRQLSDEINTAEQTVEAIYEKRVGKIVKAASFAAADLPAEVDGMTAEEQELFDELVGDIKQNRQSVLALLDNEDSSPVETTDPVDESVPGTKAPAEQAPGVQSKSAESVPPEPSERAGGGNAESAPDGTALPHSEAGSSEGRRDSDPSQRGSADAKGDHQARQHNTARDSREETPPRNGEGEGPSDQQLQQKESSESVSASDLMGAGVDVESSESRIPTDEERPPEKSSPETGSENYDSDQPVDVPVRKDGGSTEQTVGGQVTSNARSGTEAEQDTEPVERQRVQIVEDIETFLGFDDRDYDLEQDDVVSLPATNAEILLERGVAREL